MGSSRDDGLALARADAPRAASSSPVFGICGIPQRFECQPNDFAVLAEPDTGLSHGVNPQVNPAGHRFSHQVTADDQSCGAPIVRDAVMVARIIGQFAEVRGKIFRVIQIFLIQFGQPVLTYQLRNISTFHHYNVIGFPSLHILDGFFLGS